jgi:hypothetical protein
MKETKTVIANTNAVNPGFEWYRNSKICTADATTNTLPQLYCCYHQKKHQVVYPKTLLKLNLL